MKREQLGSRMGFIMLSAGCAIGCGNVWKFPWMCGQYGGGSFMLIYLLCLIVHYRPYDRIHFFIKIANAQDKCNCQQCTGKDPLESNFP